MLIAVAFKFIFHSDTNSILLYLQAILLLLFLYSQMKIPKYFIFGWPFPKNPTPLSVVELAPCLFCPVLTPQL